MTSTSYEFQINYEEKANKDINDNIYNETMDKLNNIFGEGIEFHNFISEKLEDKANNSNNCELDIIKDGNHSKENRIEDKRRKKAIYELLNFYKKANCDKGLKFKLSPFKQLIEPKKIKMNGRILLNKQDN